MDDRLFQIRRPARASGAPSSPEGAPLDRRSFMQLAGAAVALASGGCAAEVPRKILPYTRPPADVVPGLSTYYATSMTLEGYASGLLVESREGRPIKVEANLEHPATLGGTSAFAQASVRQLYDDWRGRRVRDGGDASSWEDLFAVLRAPRADQGAGLRLLLEPTSSPLLLATIQRVLDRHPQARVAYHSAVRTGADVDGAAMAFGRPLLPQYDLSAARAVVALDCDLLDELPFSVRYARQWARGRRVESPQDEPSRLYVVESRLSVTGTMADDRLRRPLSHVPAAARALAAALGAPGALRRAAAQSGADDQLVAWAKGVAADLRARPHGSTLILAGDRQPPAVHALAFAMNHALGNLGETLSFSAPVLPGPGGAVQTFEDQVSEMRAGQVDTLVVVEANPLYTAPRDLRFDQALARVPATFCLAYYEHETAARCRWYAPAAHFLESWGDGRAYDGTISMIQPLVTPLVDARTPAELLAALSGEPLPDAYRLTHDFWTRERGLDEAVWESAVQRGLQPDTALPTSAPAVDLAAVARAVSALPAPPAPNDGLTIEIYPSPTIYDGRFANNPWLQELPTPIGKLTWDNAALVSPSTATTFGLSTEDLVLLRLPHAEVEAPILIVPGLADGVAAVWLGYGRKGQENVAVRTGGFDAYALRARGRLHAVPGAALVRTGTRRDLALTQEHWYEHDRPIALRRTLAEYRRDPNFTEPHRGPQPSMVPGYRFEGNQWAMSIDLGLCTGCNACVVACQAENNLPVVGKDQVLKSREMNWLRIDTYFSGEPSAPRVVHQPMMCQHCEKAPCEYVCPVEATVHSPDGLNEMVYNRCVGTRFCSNNCPYKVRRFNWFDWGEHTPMNRGLPELQYNPEVTVRERGVMEKCTYCVQRIRKAEITARIDDREIRPGEVVTACQGACPTGAIQFGSLAHRDTDMVRWRQQDRSYAVLQREEGTQPRTYYLARIDNPNEDLG
jgi:molybdopterin-containing oxidoreductase family iron-sulfur binding subunit